MGNNKLNSARKADALGDTDTQEQCMRVLKALIISDALGLTTIDIRHHLNVMMPAARVWDLRHIYGKNVQTVWTHDVTPEGFRHRVARYVLLPGKWKGVSA